MQRGLVAWLGGGAVAILLAGMPFVVTSPYVMHLVIMSGIYIVFALSYDIVVGYLGMLSLAHPAYYGVGATPRSC